MVVIRDVSGDGESGFIAFKRPQLGYKVGRQLECAPDIRVDGGAIIRPQALLQGAFSTNGPEGLAADSDGAAAPANSRRAREWLKNQSSPKSSH